MHKPVTISLDEALWSRVDAERGQIPRSVFVGTIVAKAMGWEAEAKDHRLDPIPGRDVDFTKQTPAPELSRPTVPEAQESRSTQPDYAAQFRSAQQQRRGGTKGSIMPIPKKGQ